jgi:hypothetical protein
MRLGQALAALAVSVVGVVGVSDSDAEHAAALMSNVSGRNRSSGSTGLPLVEADADVSQRSLFWNTYRPQLYHGVRPRAPHSLMTGLMWFGLNDFTGNQGVSGRSISPRYHWLEISDPYLCADDP